MQPKIVNLCFLLRLEYANTGNNIPTTFVTRDGDTYSITKSLVAMMIHVLNIIKILFAHNVVFQVSFTGDVRIMFLLNVFAAEAS